MISPDIHSEVYDEIDGAIRWYNEQAEGLGSQFEKELDHAMACIREFPDTWPKRRDILYSFCQGKIYKIIILLYFNDIEP